MYVAIAALAIIVIEVIVAIFFGCWMLLLQTRTRELVYDEESHRSYPTRGDHVRYKAKSEIPRARSVGSHARSRASKASKASKASRAHTTAAGFTTSERVRIMNRKLKSDLFDAYAPSTSAGKTGQEPSKDHVEALPYKPYNIDNWLTEDASSDPAHPEEQKRARAYLATLPIREDRSVAMDSLRQSMEAGRESACESVDGSVMSKTVSKTPTQPEATFAPVTQASTALKRLLETSGLKKSFEEDRLSL